jgi:hypothetical protein
LLLWLVDCFLRYWFLLLRLVDFISCFDGCCCSSNGMVLIVVVVVYQGDNVLLVVIIIIIGVVTVGCLLRQRRVTPR